MSTATFDLNSGVELRSADGYVDARYTGPYTASGFGLRMHRTIEACRRNRLSRLLLDLTALERFQPTTLERYTIGCRAAQMGAGLEAVAVVVDESQLDADLFTVTVARNRGLRIEIFTDRDEALYWLFG